MEQKMLKTLEILSGNCRISTTELAKRIGQPRHIAKYHRSKLEKDGIIRGYELILNFKALGYSEYVIYLKMMHFDRIKEKICAKIEKNPNVRWFGSPFPKFNLRVALVVKELAELEAFLEGVEKEFGEYIAAKEVLLERKLLKKESYYTSAFSTEKKKDEAKQKVKLAKGDKALLWALEKSPTSSLVALAKETGMSIETIRQKMKRHMNSGLIEGFLTRHWPKKVGHNFWCVVLIDLDNISKHEDKLKTLLYSDVRFGRTRRMFGKWNIETTLFGKNFDELIENIEKVEKLFGSDIKDIELLVYKERFFSSRLPNENLFVEEE